MTHPIPAETFGRRLWSAGVEICVEIAYLLPAAAMIFITVVPAQALAFVDEIEASHRPLRFVRDPSLANSAIIGIETFPGAKPRTVGNVLNSRTSRIPEVVSPLKSGMAVRVLAMAYSSSVDQTDANPFVTASGTRVQPGTMAANFLPFGSRVRIGGSEYTVLDRMNARYNNKYIVDIWHPTHAQAIQFGVQLLEMEIVSIPGQ